MNCSRTLLKILGSLAIGTGSSVASASTTSVTIRTNDFATTQGWSNGHHVRTFADVNGDGRADIVGYSSVGVRVALSNGSGFQSARTWIANYGDNHTWRVNRHPRAIADVNGDGKADVVGFGNDQVWVSLSNGSRFGSPQSWIRNFCEAQTWRVGRHPRTVADVNGDGKADIVGFGEGGAYVSLSNGRSFGTPRIWIRDFGAAQTWNAAHHPRLVVDVNGDGRADVVGFAQAGVKVALSTGNSFQMSGYWIHNFGANQGWTVKDHARMVGDLNGDGKADIVGSRGKGTFVSLSTGSKFCPPRLVVDNFGSKQGWTSTKHVRAVADVNGDGRDDIGGFGHSQVLVATTPPNYDFTHEQQETSLVIFDDHKQVRKVGGGQSRDNGVVVQGFEQVNENINLAPIEGSQRPQMFLNLTSQLGRYADQRFITLSLGDSRVSASTDGNMRHNRQDLRGWYLEYVDVKIESLNGYLLPSYGPKTTPSEGSVSSSSGVNLSTGASLSSDAAGAEFGIGLNFGMTYSSNLQAFTVQDNSSGNAVITRYKLSSTNVSDTWSNPRGGDAPYASAKDLIRMDAAGQFGGTPLNYLPDLAKNNLPLASIGTFKLPNNFQGRAYFKVTIQPRFVKVEKTNNFFTVNYKTFTKNYKIERVFEFDIR